MPKKKPVDLKGRWKRTIAREVNALLVGQSLGPDFSSPHVGTVDVDGRTFLDLRGFPFTERFMEVAVKHVDFSDCGPEGSPGFTGVIATNCRFVGACLDGSISGTFTDCRFDKATLAALIGWPHTRFIRCVFDGARFRGGNLRKSVFEDCSFRRCKFTRTEFRGCRFDGCDFTSATFRDGVLGDAMFTRIKNNFKYADGNNHLIKYEFVADPVFPVVDLDEVRVLDTIFRAD